MNVQLIGVLLGVFSAVMAAVIFYGAFSEEKRAAREFGAPLEQN